MKYIYAALVVSVLVAGCSKDLDRQPTDVVEESKAYITVQDALKGLQGVYASYSRTNTMYLAAITSDEAKFGPENGGSGQFNYRLQYSSDATTGGDATAPFFNFYVMIDRINRVMGRIDDVTAEEAGDEALRPLIKAQLQGMRAIGHFELLSWYSKKYDAADPLGVVLMTQSCLTCQPARNTVAETIAGIEADLEAAKSVLPAPGAAEYDDLVLNRINITAFQARVALYKGEWQRAADFATTVIESGVKPLASGSDYTDIWIDEGTSEVLFRSRYDLNSGVGSMWTATGGTVIFSPSDKLTNAFSDGDIRLEAFIGVGDDGVTNNIGAGKRFVKKFFESSRGGRIVDVKAIRTSEMYLIRAEANAELNDLDAGDDDLNALRRERIAGYVDEAFPTKAVLINAIMEERFKELCFEGFRFLDLKRRALSVQRDASDVDSPLWQILPADNFRFVFPIPALELQANRNMVQNPGY